MEISSIIIRIAFGAFFVIIFDHHDGANVNTGIFVSAPWTIRKFRIHLDFLIAQGTEKSLLDLFRFDHDLS
jgi:hypothetical protein